MKIDNFALQLWQKCPALYDLRINQEYTPRKRSGALGAGGALHLGLAYWYRNHGDLPGAIKAIHEGWPANMPVDDWRTEEKVITTMIEYTKFWGLNEPWTIVGAPDSPVIEVPFSLGTGMYLPCAGPVCQLPATQMMGDQIYNPSCNMCGEHREEVEYGGIYDLMPEWSAKVYIADHKTTSVFGSTYFKQFKPNNQMTGYVWGGNKLVGHHDFSGATRMPVTGALINVIAWKQKGKTEFDRQITERSPADISEWLMYVYHECCAIQRHKVLGIWPMRTEACIGKFGACDFHSVHTLSHPQERQSRLETDYIKDKWDYELREG